VFGQGIVADELSSFGNVGEEITFWAKLDNNKGAVVAIQYPHEGDHIGMLAGSVV